MNAPARTVVGSGLPAARAPAAGPSPCGPPGASAAPEARTPPGSPGADPGSAPAVAPWRGTARVRGPGRAGTGPAGGGHRERPLRLRSAIEPAKG